MKSSKESIFPHQKTVNKFPVHSNLQSFEIDTVLVTRSDFARPILTNRSYSMDWFLVPWLRRTTLDSLDSAERGVMSLLLN